MQVNYRDFNKLAAHLTQTTAVLFVHDQFAGWRTSDDRLPRSLMIGLLLLLAIGLAVSTGCKSEESLEPFDLSQAKYVGKDACIDCHRDQVQLHTGSHHDLAMQKATEQTVLGDFDDAIVKHHDVTSRFYRQDGKFMVHTEGPDGTMQDFEIGYVFGVTPLQQYMVEMPLSDDSQQSSSPSSDTNQAVDLPRIQVLRLCWDTEKERWFYLPPPDVDEKLDPHDDLHWTGVAQRWNTMCADCHSTNYRKDFQPSAADELKLVNHSQPSGEYHSSFSEIDVSCESCHGPGSIHIEMAQKWFPGWNRERGYGLANLKKSPEAEIQSCAPCHSRRNVVYAGYQAGDSFYDYYANQLLTEGVYYPDGQILDEDYVHGSFIQSKMYHKGIKCTDCHDPHTARLKHDGNQVCTSCHQHPAAKYDTPAHHFHEPGTEAAACVNCHMPSTTYMEVDARRDHSLRIPRPDLSLKLDTPNACTGCHLDVKNVSEEKREDLQLYQDWMAAARAGDDEIAAELDRANQWCADACERWYGEGKRRKEHYGEALAAGQNGAPDAVTRLSRLLDKRGFEAPAIARATALQILSQVDPTAASRKAIESVEDASPLVRMAAAAALVGNPSATQSVSTLEKLLDDRIRCVRTEAARSLLEFPPNLRSQSGSSDFRRALAELQEGLEFNDDRAGAHMALGILAEQQGRDRQAIKHYELAIAVEPTVTGPRTNLAALLERNVQVQVNPAADRNSGLQERIDQLRKSELPLLARDADLLPEAAGIQYRYGLALYVDGQSERAAEHLVKAAELAPEEAAYAQAAAMLFESMEKWEPAIRWAKEGVARSDNDPSYVLLLQRIREAAGGVDQQ